MVMVDEGRFDSTHAQAGFTLDTRVSVPSIARPSLRYRVKELCNKPNFFSHA
jgi:hypothetical protein